MNIDIAHLRKVLDRTKIGCGDGKVVSWLGHIAIKDGAATVWNSSFGIRYLKAIDGEFSVNHERLFGIVKAFKGDEATCTVANGTFQLKSKKQTATLGIASIEDFTFPSVETYQEYLLDDKFYRALEIVVQTMPHTLKGTFGFNGVSFGVAPSTPKRGSWARLLAYDGKRFSFIEAKLDLNHHFIINAKVVDAILKLGPPISYGVGAQFIYFIYEDIVIFSRPLDVTEAHLPEQFWCPTCDFIDIQDELKDFVDNALAIGAEYIKYSAETKTLTGVEPHGDKVTLEVDLGYFCDFAINPEFLKNGLAYAYQWGLSMSQSDVQAIVFKPTVNGYIFVAGMREE